MKLWIICLVIFIFALWVRLYNLGNAGEWGDETALANKGYILASLAQNGDFSNSFWYTQASDHPPLAFYFYGAALKGDFIKYDKNEISPFTAKKGDVIFTYDFPYGTAVSIIATCISIILVYIFALRYFS